MTMTTLDTLTAPATKLKKPKTLYMQLKEKSLPHLACFKEDLTKHDRQALNDKPGVPFLHYTRGSGTHIFFLYPTEMLPATGVRVQYLFGTADRHHIIKQPLECARSWVECNSDIKIVLHFNGKQLKEISLEEAVEVAREYQRNLEEEWRTDRCI